MHKKKDKEEEMKIIDRQLIEEKEQQEAIENKDKIISKAKKIIEDIVNTKTISDEVCKSLVDKVIAYNKSTFDFYLKGNKGDFLKKEGVLLYNYHGKG